MSDEHGEINANALIADLLHPGAQIVGIGARAVLAKGYRGDPLREKILESRRLQRIPVGVHIDKTGSNQTAAGVNTAPDRHISLLAEHFELTDTNELSIGDKHGGGLGRSARSVVHGTDGKLGVETPGRPHRFITHDSSKTFRNSKQRIPGLIEEVMGHLHGKQWRVPESNKKTGLSMLASSIRPVQYTLSGFRPGSYQEAHLFS